MRHPIINRGHVSVQRFGSALSQSAQILQACFGVWTPGSISFVEVLSFRAYGSRYIKVVNGREITQHMNRPKI
jgi:hypothetical protein